METWRGSVRDSGFRTHIPNGLTTPKMGPYWWGAWLGFRDGESPKSIMNRVLMRVRQAIGPGARQDGGWAATDGAGTLQRSQYTSRASST